MRCGPVAQEKVMCLGNRERPTILYTPYIRGTSEKLEKACAPLGVKTVFKPQRTMRQLLVRVKERIPPESQREVVYEVPCKDCELKYIGETKRSLKTRMAEHKYAVRRGDERNGIAVHVHQLQHSIDWESARVRMTARGYWDMPRWLECNSSSTLPCSFLGTRTRIPHSTHPSSTDNSLLLFENGLTNSGTVEGHPC